MSEINNHFDYNFYVEYYKDLADLSYEDALAHWQNYGILEGRYGTAEAFFLSNDIDINDLPENFDYEIYFELNPDLGSANRYVGISHYLKWGKIENRLWCRNGMAAPVIIGDDSKINDLDIPNKAYPLISKLFSTELSNGDLLKKLRELSGSTPNSFLIWRQLSEVAFELERWQEAFEAITTLSKLQALKAKDYYRLGEISEHLRQFSEAFCFYLQAFLMEPAPQITSKMHSVVGSFDDDINLTNDSLKLFITSLPIHNQELYELIEVLEPYLTLNLLSNFDGEPTGFLNIIPVLLEKSEIKKNWALPLYVLGILDKSNFTNFFPDWIAVEIIWIQSQIEHLIAESVTHVTNQKTNDLEGISILDSWLIELKSLDCYFRAEELNTCFLLLERLPLKYKADCNERPINSITTLSQFLSCPEAQKSSPNILFDSDWYELVEKNDSTTIPLLIHFFRHSSGYCGKVTNPNPYFDCEWYQINYLGNTRLTNPLLHYLANFQTNNPHPWFNNGFIRRTQGLRTNEDPLTFYLSQLHAKGRDFCLTGFSASPFFDRHYYLENNQDLMIGIEKATMDPLAHFLQHGKKEGRLAHPWQLYNEIVQHQHLNLEPFNHNTEFADKNRLAYVVGETAQNAYLTGQIELANDLVYKPLISLLVPINHPISFHYLPKMIESVLAQTYPNWQICISINNSTNDCPDAIIDFLKSVSTQTSRIVYSLHEKSKIGHGYNTHNSCLNLAEGEYIALLNHDDLLSPDAFYENVFALNKVSNLDIIYSDEDKVDEWGVFYKPYYKPAWSPHSLWSRMYVGRLTVYRKSLVESVGGFRDGFDGFQDFDLLLRCSERTKNIYHVEKVLYHTRSYGFSNVMIENDNNAGYIALHEALSRQGIDATINSIHCSMLGFWVKPKIIGEPLIDIIIPSRNGAEFFSICLQSIFEKTTYQHFKITVIDNNSHESDFFALMDVWQNQEPSRFQVIRYEEPFNYSIINNLGVLNTEGDYLLFLNNDTEVLTEDWLEALLGYAQLPDTGAVGAKLYYPDNTIQHAGVATGLGGMADHLMKHSKREDSGYFGNLKLVNNYSAVTGACMMISRKKFKEVNGFSEYLKVAFNDVDFCLKLRQLGFYNIYLPFVELYHYESKSRGMEDTPEKQRRAEKELVFMRQRWGKILDNDPFYSPWLALNTQKMEYRHH